MDRITLSVAVAALSLAACGYEAENRNELPVEPTYEVAFDAETVRRGRRGRCRPGHPDLRRASRPRHALLAGRRRLGGHGGYDLEPIPVAECLADFGLGAATE